MKFKRSDRLRGLFMEEIAGALREVKDPGVAGFLTVTDLELSGDTKTARVFYSLLGKPEDRESTQKALERSVNFIRHRLYSKLRLKFIPKIVFIFDDTPERAGRVETLLAKLNSEPDPYAATDAADNWLNALGSQQRRRPGPRPRRRRR